jgi:hypothetical protein
MAILLIWKRYKHRSYCDDGGRRIPPEELGPKALDVDDMLLALTWEEITGLILRR